MNSSVIEIEYRWAGDLGDRALPTQSLWRHDADPDVQPGAFYCCWDAMGELIYVGCTIFPRRRFATHAGKPWWREVRRVLVIWYLDQVDARTAESRVLERGPLKYCRQKPYMRYRAGYVRSVPLTVARARRSGLSTTGPGQGRRPITKGRDAMTSVGQRITPEQAAMEVWLLGSADTTGMQIAVRTALAVQREQIAQAIEATVGGYPDNEVERPKVSVGEFMNDAQWAARIVREGGET